MTTPGIRLFSTDLDGTLLGNPVACWRFSDTWNSLPRGRRPLLVYNTGRSVSATLALIRSKELPDPDFIIGSVGTELHDARDEHRMAFATRFSDGWNLERVESVMASTTPATKQPAEHQSGLKSSWFWVRAQRHEIGALAERLSRADVRVQVEYSCRYFLDIVPADAGKGNGLAWLCQRLRLPLEHVLVAGDTGNDASMFLLPGVRGIVVDNALPELRAAVVRLPVLTATAETADGVLEGLQHFQLLKAGSGEKLSLEIEVAPDALDLLVPALLLQPVIENAIKHGIAKRIRPGQVQISAHREGERVCIEVCNDGSEIELDLNPAISTGVGLRTTRSRLDHLYGSNYQLELLHRAEGGMRVRFDLPCRNCAPIEAEVVAVSSP